MIREFRPDVVILVARKMPRLQDLLQLDFGKECLIISDYAIDYVRSKLSGARVAIVDDVVNVGSTMEKAQRKVVKCSPDLLSLFALARRTSTAAFDLEINYVTKAPLQETDYEDHASSVPALIGQVGRPFDLVFPILLSTSLGDSAKLFREVASEYGSDSIEVIPSPYHNSSVCRVTFFPKSNPPHRRRKIRAFRDSQENSLAFAFMSVPDGAIALTPNFKYHLPQQLYSKLIERLDDSNIGAARAQLSIFCESLDFALDSIALSTSLSALLENDELYLDEISFKYLFGISVDPRLTLDPNPGFDPSIRLDFNPSPFLTNFDVTELSRLICADLKGGDGVYSRNLETAFQLLFQNLAKMVGANNVDEYSVSWPFTNEQVKKQHHLRLEIGPTFTDIVKILQDVQHKIGRPLDSVSERNVSVLLDSAVDSGLLVPTFGSFGESSKVFRIYRKGERTGRKKLATAVYVALSKMEKNESDKIKLNPENEPSTVNFSKTRLSKICSVLGYSSRFEHMVGLRNEIRGVVGTSPRSLIDSEVPEVVEYLTTTEAVESEVVEGKTIKRDW